MECEVLELSANSPQAVGGARRVVAGYLGDWGCRNAEDVLLVFSELVTNAVRHAGGADRIVLQHSGPVVTVAVYDANHEAPEMQSNPGGLGGFGLRIVDQLAMGWGWTGTAAGKQVWAELSCLD
jgi:two-component sensor histidine kinase